MIARSPPLSSPRSNTLGKFVAICRINARAPHGRVRQTPPRPDEATVSDSVPPAPAPDETGERADPDSFWILGTMRKMASRKTSFRSAAVLAAIRIGDLHCARKAEG
jgi:hypothetical protein